MESFQNIEPIWLMGFVAIAFFAGYIDAIAGGGGMLQIPALLLGGVPPVAALATNKFVSMIGTGVVVIKYSLHRLIRWKYIAAVALPCIIASMLGSKLALVTSDWLLETTIILSIGVALAVSIFTTPNLTSQRSQKRISHVCWLTGIGLYDGFAGPGTGSFMALANNKTLGYDLVVSTAIAKPINLLTNISATIIFVYFGKVVWAVAVPMLIANALGGWAGGHFAIANGAGFIRKVLIGILTVMLSIQIYKTIVNW